MDDRTLFDVDRTQPVRCPICHTIRDAGEEKAPGCDYDRIGWAERDGRRPKLCLNTIDPAHTPWPKGF